MNDIDLKDITPEAPIHISTGEKILRGVIILALVLAVHGFVYFT